MIIFLKSLSLPKNVFPRLIVTFLSERQLKELERVGISGMDLCAILATTTEKGWECALHLCDQYKEDHSAKEAGNLVSEYFSSPERLGMTRLMEGPYHRPELQNEDFMTALQEMFP